MYMPRFRKLQQVYRYFKEQDPNTVISENLLEKLIAEGKLTQIKLHNAWLINLDEVYKIFCLKEQHNEEDING